jgi:hypothetical protein
MQTALLNSLVTATIMVVFFATTFGVMNNEITLKCLLLVVGVCASKYIFQSYPSGK